jgi:hypothetical protein
VRELNIINFVLNSIPQKKKKSLCINPVLFLNTVSPNAGFDVFFWVVTPCIDVVGGQYYFKMEAVSSSETPGIEP